MLSASVSTVLKLAAVSSSIRCLFIEETDDDGDTNLTYGRIASVNIVSGSMYIAFATGSVTILKLYTHGEDCSWCYFDRPRDVAVVIHPETCRNFECHLDDRGMRQHMADHGLAFLESGTSELQAWIRRKNDAAREAHRAEFMKMGIDRFTSILEAELVKADRRAELMRTML